MKKRAKWLLIGCICLLVIAAVCIIVIKNKGAEQELPTVVFPEAEEASEEAAETEPEKGEPVESAEPTAAPLQEAVTPVQDNQDDDQSQESTAADTESGWSNGGETTTPKPQTTAKPTAAPASTAPEATDAPDVQPTKEPIVISPVSPTDSEWSPYV